MWWVTLYIISVLPKFFIESSFFLKYVATVYLYFSHWSTTAICCVACLHFAWISLAAANTFFFFRIFSSLVNYHSSGLINTLWIKWVRVGCQAIVTLLCNHVQFHYQEYVSYLLCFILKLNNYSRNFMSLKSHLFTWSFIWIHEHQICMCHSRERLRKVDKCFLMKSLEQSVQFSHLVTSDSLWPHGLQHTRLSSPLPTPRACSNSCSSSQWCHPTISSSVIPFFFCLQAFPAQGLF